MLEVKNLYKKYGKKCVLNNMNYLFTPGIYGLLGPNGAGKSTLMNIISDVIDSSEGSVEYMGKNIKNMKAEYRKHRISSTEYRIVSGVYPYGNVRIFCLSSRS